MPESELLAFYRQRMNDFEGEREELLNMLDRVK